MNLRLRFLHSAVLGCILSSCAMSEAFVAENLAGNYGVADAQNTACILYYPSLFKETLVKDLVRDLNAKAINVTVDVINNGGLHPAARYDVVILLSGCKAGATLPLAPAYIKNSGYASNIVYFSAYTLWAIPYNADLSKGKVDAIAAASSKEIKAIQATESSILAASMKKLGR
jgi:hypothetical protein